MVSKLYGLLGHPVGHSMSPLMQNDAFKQLKLNSYYHAFDVPKGQLQEAVAAVKTLTISGFNVTIPHKVEIINYLDDIDEEAKLIGAVNTVVNVNGKLTGYNTDGRGYMASLKKVLVKPLSVCRVLVLGAGGAARGVVTALIMDGVNDLTIANRTMEKAIEIKNTFPKTNIEKFLVISLTEAQKCIGDFDIIINTTSVGMMPNVNEIPIALDNIKKTTIVSDLIYNPLQTKWLKMAEEKGAITLNGVGMFVEQGALAFEKWTGQRPNTDRMTEVVLQQLGGFSC